MLKAIETSYAGRRFRSRREARWAILFDHLNIDWRFEPDGYHLDDGTLYLPDFELHMPTGKLWVEVKPDLIHYAQLSMLCSGTKQRGVLVAEPMVRAEVIPVGSNGSWGTTSSVGHFLSQLTERDALTIQAASNAALSARWEHGERPRRPSKPGGRGPRAYQRATRLIEESSGSGSTAFGAFGS